MKKYGVKLRLYKGQEMDMWIYNENGRVETTHEKAIFIAQEYYDRNPGGVYVVEEITKD